MPDLSECPACLATDIGHHYSAPTTRRPDRPERWDIWRCAACDHGFLNPQPTWEELGAYYSADYTPYDPNHGAVETDDHASAQRARAAGTFRHLPVPAGRRVLDVGCGGGWFLRVCRELGATVVGVEPSEVASDRARAAGLDVHTGTISDFVESGWDGEPFDVVTASHVLEHTPDPTDTLAHMRKLTEPDGTVWIAVPNARSLAARSLRQCWYSTDVPYHLHHFSPDSLAIVAERAGLRLAREYTYSLPRAVASSVTVFLRRRLFIPQRVSVRLGIGEFIGDRIATRLDRRDLGEALHVELLP